MKGDDRIDFIVVDLCMAWALDVGTKLGIKGAVLCPGSATLFALLYNVPMLIEDGIIDSDYGKNIIQFGSMHILMRSRYTLQDKR